VPTCTVTRHWRRQTLKGHPFPGKNLRRVRLIGNQHQTGLTAVDQVRGVRRQGGLESVGGIDGLLKEPGIAETPAGQNRRIVAMDDGYLLSFSPRMGKALIDLITLLHPELGE